MPGFSSQANLLSRCLQLLAAVGANAEQLQAADPLKVRLDESVERLRGLLTRRDTLKAEKQILSRQLLDTAQEVNDVYLDLRATVRAALGTRSEKLTEFNLKPRRKVLRTDRRKAVPAPEPQRKAVVQQPAPAPEPDPAE
jgi:hypothetical protein